MLWGEAKDMGALVKTARQVSSHDQAIGWFTKTYEALAKEKPRGIANPSTVRATMGIMTTAIFEWCLFNDPFFEERSIKSAGTEAWLPQTSKPATPGFWILSGSYREPLLHRILEGIGAESEAAVAACDSRWLQELKISGKLISSTAD